jgi:hypothetical protein
MYEILIACKSVSVRETSGEGTDRLHEDVRSVRGCFMGRNCVRTVRF